MVIAWVLTIPVSAAVSAGVYVLMAWLVAPCERILRVA